jgi:hypothetical protein
MIQKCCPKYAVIVGMVLILLVATTKSVMFNIMLIAVVALTQTANTAAPLMTTLLLEKTLVVLAELKNGQKLKLVTTVANNSTLSSKTNALMPTVGNLMILPVPTNAKTPTTVLPSVETMVETNQTQNLPLTTTSLLVPATLTSTVVPSQLLETMILMFPMLLLMLDTLLLICLIPKAGEIMLLVEFLFNLVKDLSVLTSRLPVLLLTISLSSSQFGLLIKTSLDVQSHGP